MVFSFEPLTFRTVFTKMIAWFKDVKSSNKLSIFKNLMKYTADITGWKEGRNI